MGGHGGGWRRMEEQPSGICRRGATRTTYSSSTCPDWQRRANTASLRDFPFSPVFHRRPSSETEARRLHSDSLAADTYMNVHRPLVQIVSSVCPPTDASAGTVPPACQRARHPHGGGRAPRFFSCIINELCASFTWPCMFTCTEK